MQPSNSDILDAVLALASKIDKKLENIDSRLDDMDRRIASLEIHTRLLTSSLQEHGKYIGTLIRATPIPTGDCG